MSRKRSNKRTKRVCEEVEIDSDEDGATNAVYIPNENDSGSSDSESDSDEQVPSNSSNKIPNVSYHKVLDDYKENQSILEPNHHYNWVHGEKKYTEILEDKILLSDTTKKKIQSMSYVELFELYFSTEIKNYIIESTQANSYPLTLEDLHVFLGIIMLSIVNIRKSQKDYWSNKPLLECKPIKSAMSRNKFLEIKSKIKLSKAEDQNSNDKAWKVRKVLEIYRKNCLQFGFFSTALSIDEMMVKFHGRTNLLQFLPNKPDRFGLKMIGIASSTGYLFDCNIYCGQGSQVYSADEKLKLSKCSLGSRFVMLMVQNLLTSVVHRKIMQYHLWFDNYFTNPDLLVHLHNLGLRATGTVRVNRVKVQNHLDNKAERGTFVVQHEKNTGMNFITVKDSKQVSILSTAAGITPLQNMKRYSAIESSRVNLDFPMAFKLYNMFMGGIDQHNEHCSNAMPCIAAKKWTWPMFKWFIRSSIANATALRNSVCDQKIGTKEIILELAEHYLAMAAKKKLHELITVKSKKNCSNVKHCGKRSNKICKPCNVYICLSCFSHLHEN